MSAVKTSLLDAIMNADGKELEIIDDKLKELEHTIGILQAEAAKLRALRKTVSILINGKPERKKREPKAKDKPASPAAGSLDVLQRRKHIARLLLAEGAMKPAAIAQALNASAANVGYWLSSGHFTKDDKGYHLTPIGRNELLD